MVKYSRCLFFFFSSRRRHTRYWRDWSSDVCSSDLFLLRAVGRPTEPLRQMRGCVVGFLRRAQNVLRFTPQDWRLPVLGASAFPLSERSEERRVGKECRYRGSPYHLKKK